jgi:hypothetical protein
MAIEIRELIIKAEVRDARDKGTAPTGGGGPSADRGDLVRECVEQVMQILQDKNAR